MSLARVIKVNSHDTEVTEQLRRIIARITSLRPDVTIRAFGSLARGEMSAESDLDLAVIVPDDTNLDEFRKTVRKGVVLSHPWPLDLLFLHQTRYLERSTFGGVCVDIAEDGVELYPNWKLT